MPREMAAEPGGLAWRVHPAAERRGTSIAVLAMMITLSALAVIAALCALFATLTVEVTHEAVGLRFGIGLVRKSFAVGEPFSTSQPTSPSCSSLAITKWNPKSIRAP